MAAAACALNSKPCCHLLQEVAAALKLRHQQALPHMFTQLIKFCNCDLINIHRCKPHPMNKFE
jgi:hypothetical protein